MQVSTVSILRCIWSRDKDHPPSSSLRRIGTEAHGLLQCTGCQAVFLIEDGIPVLLTGNALSKQEEMALRERKSRLRSELDDNATGNEQDG